MLTIVSGFLLRRPNPITKGVLLTVLLLASYALKLQADLLTEGRRLQEDGKHQEAARLFSNAALAGDPIGAYGLGVLYFKGQGVPKDLEQSNHWFLIASEKDYAPAQYNLGNAFLHGRGVVQNLDAAETWWRKAAQQGYAHAQYNLGSLLYSNGNTAEMREEGIAWYRAAAKRDFAKAVRSLREIGEPMDLSKVGADPAREPQRSEARLMTLDPSGFTIQLYLAGKPASAMKFIDRFQLAGRAAPFRFLREGVTWTAVVYGWYAGRDEARATIDALKPPLKETDPWIRPVAQVQEKIREVWSNVSVGGD